MVYGRWQAIAAAEFKGKCEASGFQGTDSAESTIASRGSLMKRRRFLKYLAQHGCVLEEGTKHTRVFNPANELRSHVPRHGEVKPFLLRPICKQLGIPAPTGRWRTIMAE